MLSNYHVMGLQFAQKRFFNVVWGRTMYRAPNKQDRCERSHARPHKIIIIIMAEMAVV